MASRNQNDILLADKIEDLTHSLHRTTDVLSTADRMLDHYRNLNQEQEHEIARVRKVYSYLHNNFEN